MIRNVEIRNFGPLPHLTWDGLRNINLVIGTNATGKTFLLKAIYSALRTLEEYGRGNDPRTLAEVTFEKLYWTFQAERVGDLVTKGATEPLQYRMTTDGGTFSYRILPGELSKVTEPTTSIPPSLERSVFLPAKEILTLFKVILASRDRDRMFGFDDTYVDLARILMMSPQVVRRGGCFDTSRQRLERFLDGKMEFDESSNAWMYHQGGRTFPVGVTAEGIKKVGILDRLLGSTYLQIGSCVFMDEPEAGLHPQAVSLLVEIVHELSRWGLQFFIATHSYFVVKKLHLLGRSPWMEDGSMPVLSATMDADSRSVSWTRADMQDGMPDNPIIDEAIRLYEEEVDGVLE